MSSVERQVRVLMRSWPRPVRHERGEEIVGTTLDLVADEATHIPLLIAVNLVVGGLRARWRIRPPVWRWAYYRAGGRLSSRWHRWMLNDLLAPGWRRRVATGPFVGVLIGLIAAEMVTHQAIPVLLIVSACVGAAMGALAGSRMNRDRSLMRHGYRWPSLNDRALPPPPAAPPSRYSHG
jgi:hypothetical protein